MSTTKADIELMVTARTAAQAIASVEQRMRTMLGSMETATRRQEKAAASVSERMEGWAKGLGRAALASLGFMGTMQSIRTIVGLVRAEIDAMVAVQEQAAERQIPFGQAVRRLSYQLPDDSDMTAYQIRDAIIASKSGRDPLEMVEAAIGAISAESTAPVSQRIEAVLTTAEMRPYTEQGGLKPLVEAALIQKRANPEQTFRQIVATMAIAQSAARQDDPEMFAKNIAAPAAMLQQFGFTQQESLTFGAALGTSAEDPEGDVTRTALMNFATDLQKKAIETGLAKDAADMMRKMQAGDESVAHLRTEFLGALDKSLADDPEELAKYRMVMAGKSDPGDLHGRARIKYYLSSMIQEWRLEQEAGANTAQAMFRDLMERDVIKTGAPAEEAFERGEQKMMGDPHSTVVEADRMMKRFEQKMELDPDQAMRARTIKFIETMRLKTGGTKLYSSFEKLFNQMQSGELTPEEALAKVTSAAEDSRLDVMLEGLGLSEYEERGARGYAASSRAEEQMGGTYQTRLKRSALARATANELDVSLSTASEGVEILTDTTVDKAIRRRLGDEDTRTLKNLDELVDGIQELVEINRRAAAAAEAAAAANPEPRQIRDPAAAALEGLGN